MKKICIDARMALISGIGRYIRSIVPFLKARYSIELIVNHAGQNCSEFSDCKKIISKSSIYSIKEQVSFPLTIPTCDLFWSPHFNVPLFPIRAKKRLVTIHDVFFLAFPEHLNILKKCYAKSMFNAAVRLADHVVTISQFSKSEIDKYIGLDSKKITSIPLGVNGKQFQLPGSLGDLEVAPKYILYVGNLAIHKNIQRLIQSLDYLDKEIHLVLAGKEVWSSVWREDFEKRKERITLCGNVSESQLTWLYQHALALVHPSFYEGFGLTPLEAMSAGCPVISSNAASLPEVCGEAAEYVDPFSTHDIARGIRTALEENRRKELQKKGFAQVEKFSWDRCAQEHIEVIDRLI